MKHGNSARVPDDESYTAHIKEPHVFAREASIERPLGATENLYWRFDALSPLNFGVVVRLAGRIDIPELQAALLALQYRHPLLRVKILPDQQKHPWFRSVVSEIDVRVVDAEPAHAWRLLEAEVNTPLNTQSGPLMRCILARHGTEDQSLVMTFHHAISDGKSAIYLTRDILQSIKQQREGDSERLASLAPVGYYGDYMPKFDPTAGTEPLKKAWNTLKAVTQFMDGVGFPMGLQRYSEPALVKRTPGVMIEERIVESDTMQALARRAKAEGTTMQCVLNAALSLTVAADSPTGFLQRTACSQVLDMRDRLDPPVGENCGLFASGATSLHALTAETEFWPLARKIYAQLQHSIVTPLPFFHPAMHRHFIRLANGLGQYNYRAFSEFIGRLHPEGLAVSNLGRVTIEVENSPLRVTSFGFGTNTTVLNYLSTSAATLDGRMIWSFNGCNTLTRERLAHTADKTITRMLRALKE